MLAPWHAYTFPCGAQSCTSVARALKTPTVWQPSNEVRTLSYGTSSITYAVNIARPVVMAENELAVDGWHSNSARVKLVKSPLPFRTWQLSAG